MVAAATLAVPLPPLPSPVTCLPCPPCWPRLGTQLSGKTFGVVGTGKIGVEFVRLLQPYKGRILAYDVYESQEAKDLGEAGMGAAFALWWGVRAVGRL